MQNMEVRSHPASPGTLSPEENEARLHLLIETGLILSRERSLDVIVQAALDAARSLACAQFGVFFYDVIASDASRLPYYKISFDAKHRVPGIPDKLPDELPACASHEHPHTHQTLRSDDFLQDERFTGQLFLGTPFSEAPLRSYLVVPVTDRDGNSLGCMHFVHSKPREFHEEAERLVTTIAAQAGAAIDNSRLTDNLTHEIALTDNARQLQRETVSRLRQALDAGQLGTWSWSRDTDLMDLDERAAELFEFEPHTPISRSDIRNRILEEDRDASPIDVHERLESGGAYSTEYRIRTREGRQRWLSTRGLATFKQGTTELTGMTGTVQDITVRKGQEATLRQSEKLAATGRMAATIAHEINNPLEAVTNLIYLCKTDPAIPPAIQQLLETADNELARVAQIAQQTLGFYRDTTRPVDIDITAMLTGVVNLFSRKMQYKHLDCKLDVQPGLHIFGLQGELRQVFSNLLVNAIDASTRSTIRVRARIRMQNGKPGVSVIIADQGAGIPAAVRERLFSPFFTTKATTGTGLGLWVTRGIIEKQGGSVRFRTSTEAPSGTVFRIFLPTEFLNPEIFNAPESQLIQ